MTAALALLASTPPPPTTLTAGGWITMLLSVGFVVCLFGWCIWRVIKAPPPGKAPRLAHVEPIERDQADER